MQWIPEDPYLLLFNNFFDHGQRHCMHRDNEVN